MTSTRGAITQAENKRERKYTPKQRKFLKLFTENDFKDAKACATKAGYGKSYYNCINSLKDDIKNIAEILLVSAAPGAASSLVEVLESDKPIAGVQNKLAAAREILDRSGVVKIEKQQVQHEVKGGVFLLPVKHELMYEEEQDIIDGEWEEEYEN